MIGWGANECCGNDQARRAARGSKRVFMACFRMRFMGLRLPTGRRWCHDVFASEQPLIERLRHRAAPRMDVQLLVNAAQMIVHRMITPAELVGNFLFEQSFDDQGCIKLVMGNRTKGGIRFLGSVFPRPRSV